MPVLVSMAEDLSDIVLAMPPDERDKCRASVLAIVEAAKGLSGIPPAAMNQLWKLLMTFVGKMAMPGAKPERLLIQVVEGARPMLSAADTKAILGSMEGG